jgi:hypothetical protein
MGGMWPRSVSEDLKSEILTVTFCWFGTRVVALLLWFGRKEKYEKEGVRSWIVIGSGGRHDCHEIWTMEPDTTHVAGHRIGHPIWWNRHRLIDLRAFCREVSKLLMGIDNIHWISTTVTVTGQYLIIIWIDGRISGLFLSVILFVINRLSKNWQVTFSVRFRPIRAWHLKKTVTMILKRKIFMNCEQGRIAFSPSSPICFAATI